MKIDRFNEAKTNTYYKLYVYVGYQPTEMSNDYDTVKEAFDELKYTLSNGLPGTDNKTYYIHDAYIEKVMRVKEDEIKILINSKKYNI
jgi:hypothetical protein